MADQIRKINADTRTVRNVIVKAQIATNANITAIDVDASGNLYAADTQNDCIYKFHADSSVHGTVVGKFATAGNVESSQVNAIDGTSSYPVSRITDPFGMCVDKKGTVYAVTSAKIVKISPSGRTKVLAGSTAGMTNSDTGTSVQFSSTVYGLAVAADGTLFVADTGNHRIRKVFDGGKTVTLAGFASGMVNGSGNTARFASPYDCCVDNAGNVFVADYGNNRVRKIDTTGTVTSISGGFSNPSRICCDNTGNLYVLDTGNYALKKVTQSGVVTTILRLNQEAATNCDICVDNSGFIYVAESGL